MNRRMLLLAGLAVALTQSTTLAQTPEIEPNGAKTEATPATLDAGDTITGSCTGGIDGAGNTAVDSSDFWDITTAVQPTAGWYRWTLTMTAGNGMDIRGLDATGVACAGGAATAGTNNLVFSESAGTVSWYSNEGASRLYIRVDGDGSSPNYTGTLSVAAVTPIAGGTFDSGMISIYSEGLTTQDTDIAVADATRTVIPDHQNDDTCVGAVNAPGFQSTLTRMYTPGTYYLLAANFDLASDMPAATDDAFTGGNIMDFPNTITASSTGSNTLDFEIDDGSGAVPLSVTTTGPHGIEIVEFTVVAGGDYPSLCNGDGGDQMGCTPCACGNEAPVGTTGGCLNSASTSGLLVGSGDSSVTAPDPTDLRFDAEGLTPVSFAVLTSGSAIAPQNAANPCFGTNSGVQAGVLDGLRCAVQSTQRHGGRPVAADGTVGSTTNGWGGASGPPAGLAAQGGFVSGQTRHYQVFYRELPGTVCLTEQNTTQAVTVVFTP